MRRTLPVNRYPRSNRKQKEAIFAETFFLLLVGMCLFLTGIWVGHHHWVPFLDQEISLKTEVTEQSLLPSVEYTFTEKLTKPVKPKKEIQKEKSYFNQNQPLFSIQVASFQNVQQAQELITQLIAKDYRAYLGPEHYYAGQKWYRVWVGPFFEREEAQRKLNQMGGMSFFSSSFLVPLTPKQLKSQDG